MMTSASRQWASIAKVQQHRQEHCQPARKSQLPASIQLRSGRLVKTASGLDSQLPNKQTQVTGAVGTAIVNHCHDFAHATDQRLLPAAPLLWHARPGTRQRRHHWLLHRFRISICLCITMATYGRRRNIQQLGSPSCQWRRRVANDSERAQLSKQWRQHLCNSQLRAGYARCLQSKRPSIMLLTSPACRAHTMVCCRKELLAVAGRHTVEVGIRRSQMVPSGRGGDAASPAAMVDQRFMASQQVLQMTQGLTAVGVLSGSARRIHFGV